MKKILLTLLTVVMSVSAWAYTLPTSTMDLKTITAGTMGTWADQDSYYLLDDYLLVSAASSRASVSNQKWITYASAGTSNSNLTANWVANTPFKGSTAYTNQNYVTIQANRNLVYRVKNCKSVSIYGKNNSTSKYLQIYIYEVTDGQASANAAYTLTYTTDANPHVWSQTLDKDKEYVVDIEGVGNSNSQVYELAFERNVVADNRLEPQLSLSDTELEAHVGDAEFTEPVVTSAGGYTGSYEYSSSKPAVASVNATTGEVTIGAAGTATITVSVPEGDANYKPRSVSYTIIVHKVAPVGAVFYESFDQFNGQGGNDGIWSNLTVTPALGTYDNSGWTTEGTNYSGKECVSIRKAPQVNGKDVNPSGLTTPAIGVAGYGTVQFEAESWGSDGSNFFVDIVGGGTFVADANLLAGNISNNGTTAKVAMKKTGDWTTFALKFVGLTASSKFRFYAPAGKRAFLDEVAVFVTPANVTISAAGYATYVTPCALDFEGTGVTAYTVAPDLANDQVVLTPVTKVPADKAIVVKGDEGTHNITTIASADDIETGLEVSANSITATDEDTHTYYYLGQEAGVVGFRPLAEGGTLAAGKCFFKEAKAAGANFLTLSFSDEATGIQSVQQNAQNSVAYNLAGQRVAANAKGIVIMNGKKYLNK